MGRRVEIKGKIKPPNNFKKVTETLTIDGFVITFNGDNFTAVNENCEMSVEEAKYRIREYLEEILLSLAILSNQPKLEVELQGVTEYGTMDGKSKEIVLHNSISITASAHIAKEYNNKDIEEAISKKDLISNDDNLKEAVKNYTEALEHAGKNNALAIYKLYKSIEYIKRTGKINELGISKKRISEATDIMNNPEINESRHGKDSLPTRNIRPDELQYCFNVTRNLITKYIDYLGKKKQK